MSGLNAFAVNIKAEENGVWVKVNEMKFLIARIGNASWKKEYEKLETNVYGANKRKKNKRNTDKDVEIMLECLGKTCLLGWENVSLDGKDVKFSVEKSVEIMVDKRLRPLAEFLLECASDEDRFMEDQIEEDSEAAKK